MATDRKLKDALLKSLDVTPGRLSQRVGEVKQDLGPMSTEDATYVIAHQDGMDLTKYLDPGVVDRIRSLVPKQHIKTVSSRKKKGNRKKQVVVKIGPSLPKLDVFLSHGIADDARKMSELYPKYYMLENSVRVVIKRILEHKYGNRWWQKKVARPLRDKVQDRKDSEAKQPWHGKRGQHEIFYSDFGDLKKIIQKNWEDFKDLFPTQAWITQKLDELEHPRNVLAHHNPVNNNDSKRIELYFDDWTALLQSRKHLIP